MAYINKIALALAATLLMNFLAVADEDKVFSKHELQTDSMSDILDGLKKLNVNLAKTAVFFDFDETLVRSQATIGNQTYNLLFSPDRIRTYGKIFEEAIGKANMEGHEEVIQELRSYSTPKIFDSNVVEFINQLKLSGAFVAICSALPETPEKTKIRKKLGISYYVYGGNSDGKAGAIKDYFQTEGRDEEISTIVLIDNSKEFALDQFMESMPDFARQLPQIKNSQEPTINIIGIEFTKFTQEATKEAIKAEYKKLTRYLKDLPVSED